MGRKGLLESTMIAAGSLLLGGAEICRFLNDKEPVDSSFPRTVGKIHRGNMKEVLVIVSTRTKLGNTDRLTDAYIKGLVERGCSVTKVYLGSTRIEGCRGCDVCQRSIHQCAVRDGTQDIYSLLTECDTMVMTSPLYFWTVTLQPRVLIGRLCAISADDKYPQEGTILLMTAGDDNEDTLSQLKQHFRPLSQALGWNEVGIYCAGGCAGCEELTRQIGKVHLESVYKMGLEL